MKPRVDWLVMVPVGLGVPSAEREGAQDSNVDAMEEMITLNVTALIRLLA